MNVHFMSIRDKALVRPIDVQRVEKKVLTLSS